MSSTLFFILSIFISNFSHDKSCIKGDIKYSVATYKDEIFLKEEYRKRFHSLLYNPVSNYFCNEEIKNLSTTDDHKDEEITPPRSVIIEPLFINLKNFDGVYSCRIYGMGKKVRNPRFRCGYYHYLFLISNNQYFDFSEDSLANETLIRTNLTSSFSKDEISRMVDYYKYKIICDDFTFLPPTYIKKGDEVIFDASKE